MSQLKIEFRPQYILTYIPKGRKTKQTLHFDALRRNGMNMALTPMEILIEAKKNGWEVTNMRRDPDCPAVIVPRR